MRTLTRLAITLAAGLVASAGLAPSASAVPAVGVISVTTGSTPGSVLVTYVPENTYSFPGPGNWIGVAKQSSGLSTCTYDPDWILAPDTGWTGYIPGTAGEESAYEFSSVTGLTSPDFGLEVGETYIFCLIDQDNSDGYAVGVPVLFTMSGGSAPSAIPVWQQSYARASSDAACEDGWNPSYAEWPNGGTGGWVCVRDVPAFGS